MSQWFARPALALAVFACAGNGLTARALMVRQAAVPERVVAADTIVVGKVVSIEDKEVEASAFPGSPEKATYRVASIKVDEILSGAKGVTHVRVGFIPAPPVDPGRPVRPIRPAMNAQFTIGDEGVFFLARHHEADFQVVPPTVVHIDKKADGFAKQVAFVRKAVQLMADPQKGLKADDAGDRFLTAAMLLQKYGTPRSRTGKPVQRELIPAEESKLILKALYDVDWTKQDSDYSLMPLSVFLRLGVQPKDGFKHPQPKPGQDYNKLIQDAAKAWLKDNLATYRVQRFVEVDRK